MNDRDTQYFYEVAKCLNFTEAAKNLYISQPALSKQIARLEAELGFPLFLRDKQGVTLAPGGVVVLNESRRVTAAYQHMLDQAKLASEGKQGALRICIQDGQMLDEHILERIRNFRRQYPDIELYVESLPYRQLLDHLQRSEIDIGLCLCFDPADFGGLCSRVIKHMPSYIVLSDHHPLAVPGALEDLSVLSDVPLLVVGSELVPQGAPFVRGQCGKCRIFPRKTLLLSSYSTLYLRLYMGDGFAFMTQNVWYANKALRFTPLPDFLAVDQTACWPRNSRNPAVPLFLDTI